MFTQPDQDSYAQDPTDAATCPTQQAFQIGDTVRFKAGHIAAGDCGVVVAHEVWLNDNEAAPWDGVGERPFFAGKMDFCANTPRYLIRLTELGKPMVDSLEVVNGWRERCRQHPHSYPWAVSRDIELASRPKIKVLNDSGELGAVIAADPFGGVTCISDSEAGARKAMADMKAANGLSLRWPESADTSRVLRFCCEEVMETKVAPLGVRVGFQFAVGTMFGCRTATISELNEDAGTGVTTVGSLAGMLKRKDDGWYDQHILVNMEGVMRAKFTIGEGANEDKG